jgi:exodeoxyribonuclease V alpha subunit
MIDPHSQRPFLALLLKNKILLTVDYFFASKFYIKSNENILLALSYIFAVARNGHLCVKIVDKEIYPDPKFLFFDSMELFASLKEKLIDGFSNLPNDLIEKEARFENEVKPIFFFNNSYYLHRNYIFESSISNNFLNLSRTAPSTKFSKERVDEELANFAGLLHDLQREAIKKAVENSISFIFGGPGTGKTYIAAILIDLLTKLAKTNFRVILTAPTGKATLNLESKIKIPIDSCSSISINSYTLHSLLNVNSVKGKIRSVDADLLIIDEASMIDAKMLCLLLESIKPGARAVFIGDPDQLPPIESGNLFSVFARLDLEGKTTTLKRSVRNDTLQMNMISEAIRKKEAARTLKLLKEADENISYNEIGDNIYQITNDILEKVGKHYLSASFEKQEPEVLLKKFSDFKILTALKVGTLGVDSLNHLIYEYINSFSKDDSSFAYPIMITKNDYDLDLYNGTLGVVIKKKIKHKIEEKAYFLCNIDLEGVREVPLYKLSSYELAYVISVHKSQGSEFDDVLLVLPKASTIFGKELLYTAVTRSKKRLNILGSDKIIIDLVTSSFEIQSNLYERLSVLC